MIGKDGIRGQRLPRWLVVLVAVASAVTASIASQSMAGTAAVPTGCTDISATPPSYSGIQFGAGIEGIFTNFNGLGQGCADCHTTAMGTQTAAGFLDLDPADAPSPYANLINVPSPDDPSLTYVVPNHPERSLLFWKVNCTEPGTGGRMPLDGYPDGMTLSLYQQALIWNWIAEGAPSGTTNGIFRDTFDIRGLFIDGIFQNGFEIP